MCKQKRDVIRCRTSHELKTGDKTIVVVTKPQLWWQNHSCGDKTTVVVTKPQLWWQNHSCGDISPQQNKQGNGLHKTPGFCAPRQL